MWKVGARKTFNHPQKGEWVLKEIVDVSKDNIVLNWTWDKGACPHCEKKIFHDEDMPIEQFQIWENDCGDIFTTADTKPIPRKKNGETTYVKLFVRIPDKDFCSSKNMSDIVKGKCKLMKEKI